MWRNHSLLSATLFLLVVLRAMATPTPDPGPPSTITPAAPAVAPTAPSPGPALDRAETTLGRRETLESALVRTGLAREDAVEIVDRLRGQVNMRRLRPGERLAVTRDAASAIVAVTYGRSPIERYEITRREGQWSVEAIRTPVETRVVAVGGRLEDSLFSSMERLGETAALVAAFVALFEWDFDFAADSLPGDRFRLLVEKRYAEGEFLGYGDVLIAEYASAGRPRFVSLAFDAGDGRTQHFDAAGRSTRKTFLRAPLDFTRVTSGFSHARKHPILGGVRPHLAIDYAAPVGTPVRAVADGVVQAAGWNGGNGLSIVLRHARGYETRYNHLSATLVRPGQRVRQRDLIGRVGSTGLSTGPHLDYRVSRNGHFVNPLAERFIPGAPVPANRRREFDAHRDALLERLEREAPLAPETARS
jgi:murein DD-endopeptidase MepM/ murein hydrolase activator NlpD